MGLVERTCVDLKAVTANLGEKLIARFRGGEVDPVVNGSGEVEFIAGFSGALDDATSLDGLVLEGSWRQLVAIPVPMRIMADDGGGGVVQMPGDDFGNEFGGARPGRQVITMDALAAGGDTANVATTEVSCEPGEEVVFDSIEGVAFGLITQAVEMRTSQGNGDRDGPGAGGIGRAVAKSEVGEDRGRTHAALNGVVDGAKKEIPILGHETVHLKTESSPG